MDKATVRNGMYSMGYDKELQLVFIGNGKVYKKMK